MQTFMDPQVNLGLNTSSQVGGPPALKKNGPNIGGMTALLIPHSFLSPIDTHHLLFLFKSSHLHCEMCKISQDPSKLSFGLTVSSTTN